MTKIDVLSGIHNIQVAVGYEVEGQIYDVYPGFLQKETPIRVIYEKMKGWDEDISQIKKYDDLPENCRHYIETVERLIDCRISTISVGPDRSQNIYRHSLGISRIDKTLV